MRTPVIPVWFYISLQKSHGFGVLSQKKKGRGKSSFRDCPLTIRQENLECCNSLKYVFNKLHSQKKQKTRWHENDHTCITKTPAAAPGSPSACRKFWMERDRQQGQLQGGMWGREFSEHLLEHKNTEQEHGNFSVGETNQKPGDQRRVQLLYS